MAGTKAAIDYSTNSGMIRATIDNNHPDDDDANLYLGQRLMAAANEGVSRVIISRDDLYALGPHECLRRFLGVDKLADDRCAVVDASGNVVKVIKADAEIDRLHGHELVNHPHVEVGWKRVAARGPIKATVVDPNPKTARVK